MGYLSHFSEDANAQATKCVGALLIHFVSAPAYIHTLYSHSLCVPVGEVAWRGLPCPRWGVAYAWRDTSMLPPGCGNFNKVLSYGVTM
jgi:hypothetical protein